MKITPKKLAYLLIGSQEEDALADFPDIWESEALTVESLPLDDLFVKMGVKYYVIEDDSSGVCSVTFADQETAERCFTAENLEEITRAGWAAAFPKDKTVMFVEVSSHSTAEPVRKDDVEAILKKASKKTSFTEDVSLLARTPEEIVACLVHEDAEDIAHLSEKLQEARESGSDEVVTLQKQLDTFVQQVLKQSLQK